MPEDLIGAPAAAPRQPNQTIEAVAPQVAPSLDLFQPTYPLSEQNFMRLRKTSPALAAIGGTVFSFGLSYGLPIAVKVFRERAGDRVWPIADVWIVVILMTFGGVTMLAGLLFSIERFRVIRAIRAHFRTNPGRLKIGSADNDVR